MEENIKSFLLEQTNLKLSSKASYRAKLMQFASFLGFKINFSKEDIIKYLNRPQFLNLKISSQNFHKKILKKYLSWRKFDTGFIKLKRTTNDKLNPESLLSPEEINLILKNMARAIDKAIFTTLLEGLRVGELINLRISDFTDKNTHGMLYIRESKSSKRPVVIIRAVPYITSWLNQHPQQSEGEAFLFVRKYSSEWQPYTVRGIELILKRNNPTDKRIYPHLLRHCSATFDLRAGVPNMQVILKHGWKTTAMLKRYVHLTSEDVESKYLEVYGIKKVRKEAASKLIDNKICPRCRYMNPGINKFCSRCGGAMNLMVVLDHRDIAAELDNINLSELLKKLELRIKKLEA